MTPTAYQIVWRNPDGRVIGYLDSFTSMDLAYGEMTVGAMDLTLPRRNRTPDDFKVDQILEVNRSTNGGPMKLEGERSWFIRDWDFYEDHINLKAFDNLYLVDGRHVLYKATTAQATATNEKVDDLIKRLVRENMGSIAADTARRLSNFSVQANIGAGPVVTKEFSLNKLLDLLRTVATTALNSGVYITFDVVTTGPGQFEFRTFKDRRGADHTTAGSLLTFSVKNYNLKDVVYRETHADERNYCVSAGKGENTARVWGTASTTAALNASIWNRRELVADGRSSGDVAVLNADAAEQLQKNRAKIIITGTVVQTTGCRYGEDYGFGDIVAAEAWNRVVACRINVVHIKVDDRSKETIDIKLRGEV